MFNLFLIFALSMTSYHKNREDNLAICKSLNENQFCEQIKLDFENDKKALAEYEKVMPSDF